MSNEEFTVKVTQEVIAGLTPPDEGVYRMFLDRVELHSTDKGPYLRFFATIIECKSEPDRTPEVVGKRVIIQTSLLPNALWKLNQLYHACTGHDLPVGEYKLQEFYESINAELVQPKRTFVGIIRHETYQGEVRARCDEFYPDEEKETELGEVLGTPEE